MRERSIVFGSVADREEGEDLLRHLSYDPLEGSYVHFDQFLMVFSGAMLRGALLNLKAYVEAGKGRFFPLEMRLLEYQRNVYMCGLGSSPHEKRILQAITEHRTHQLQLHNKGG